MARKAPVHEEIKRQLRERIEGGDLSVGDRVPSEIEWAKALGVSRNRTRQALRELELEGLIIRKQGSGSYVAPQQSHVSILPRESAQETVGIVFPRYGSGYFQQVMNGFFQYTSQKGMPTLAYNTQTDQSAEPGFLEEICESGLSGLAIWLEYDCDEAREMLQRQSEKGFPIVLVDRCREACGLDCVTSDNREIGRQLTQTLTERGHRRIAFLGVRPFDPSSIADRLAGYRQALEEASLEPDDHLVMDMGHFKVTPDEVAKDVLALRDRPTGFVCIHDGAAAQLHAELTALGYRVPENAEIAAVHDGYSGAYADAVPLWATVQDGQTIGATAAEMLLNRIAEPGRPTARRIVAPGPVRHVEFRMNLNQVFMANKRIENGVNQGVR